MANLSARFGILNEFEFGFAWSKRRSFSEILNPFQPVSYTVKFQIFFQTFYMFASAGSKPAFSSNEAWAAACFFLFLAFLEERGASQIASLEMIW